MILKDCNGCFTTKFNVCEQERCMCGAITLWNGGEKKELNDSLNRKTADKKNQGGRNTVVIFMWS